MTITDPASQSWHIDRRVPVALILTVTLTFLVQTGAFIRYMSGLENRVSRNESALQSMANNNDRILRLEATVEFQTDTLRRIETKVDRLDQKLDDKP